MKEINVVYINYRSNVPAKSYWDQAFIESVFANEEWDSGYKFIGSKANIFIENAVYGSIATGGLEKWNDYKLALYHPEGNIKRSNHIGGRETDGSQGGRAGEPKYPMIVHYDGETPLYAPRIDERFR